MDMVKDFLVLVGLGPDALQALIWLSLACTFGTQVLKKIQNKIGPELLSVLIGTLCAPFFWPEPIKSVVVGAIIGAFWAAAYKPFVRALYKKWPDLEEKVSAKPQKLVQTPEGLVLRDEDVESGANEQTQMYVVTIPKERMRDGDSK